MKNVINYWALIATIISTSLYLEGHIKAAVAVPLMSLAAVAYMLTQPRG